MRHQHLRLLRFEQLGVAQHGRQRRSNLVADVLEKLVSGNDGSLGIGKQFHALDADFRHEPESLPIGHRAPCNAACHQQDEQCQPKLPLMRTGRCNVGRRQKNGCRVSRRGPRYHVNRGSSTGREKRTAHESECQRIERRIRQIEQDGRRPDRAQKSRIGSEPDDSSARDRCRARHFSQFQIACTNRQQENPHRNHEQERLRRPALERQATYQRPKPVAENDHRQLPDHSNGLGDPKLPVQQIGAVLGTFRSLRWIFIKQFLFREARANQILYANRRPRLHKYGADQEKLIKNNPFLFEILLSNTVSI